MESEPRGTTLLTKTRSKDPRTSAPAGKPQEGTFLWFLPVGIYLRVCPVIRLRDASRILSKVISYLPGLIPPAAGNPKVTDSCSPDSAIPSSALDPSM